MSECEQLFHKAVHEVCEEYESGRVIGELCPDLCELKSLRRYGDDSVAKGGDAAATGSSEQERGSGRMLRLIDCPDLNLHGGKEIVVALIWRERTFVLKGKKASIRSLMRDLPVRSEAIHQRAEDYFAAVVNDSLAAVTDVDQGISRNIHHLTPWRENGLASMNLSSWRTLSLLSQDPEFLMTRLLQACPLAQSHQTRDQLFPSIASSCGHLFLAEYADHVLDGSYVIPSIVPFVSRSGEEKIDAGVKLLHFLIRFTKQSAHRDLCDVKINQFALFSTSDQLLLIDSDMIYTKEFVRTSLGAVHSCKSNQDCDFFDCRGICMQPSPSGGIPGDGPSICEVDNNDNNLKRICRNIIFPFACNLFGFRMNLFGLLSDVSSKNFADEIAQITHLCESSSGARMLQSAEEMLQIFENIKMNI